jgi:hypothetical protein
VAKEIPGIPSTEKKDSQHTSPIGISPSPEKQTVISCMDPRIVKSMNRTWDS